MDNLDEMAFPLIEPADAVSASKGFTKHEYATIEMAKALASNYHYLPNAEERNDIAGVAYQLAELVLSYFK